MLRVVIALLLLTSCASRTVSGRVFEADLPGGWHAGEAPLSSSMRPLLEIMPRGGITMVSMNDDHGHVITVLETAPPPRQPDPELSPQARLIGEVVKLKPAVPGTEPEPTAHCPRAFQWLHLPGDARAVDHGGLRGCESSFAGEDGPASITMTRLEDACIVYVRCSSGTPDLDRACERVLRSLRLRTPTK